MNGFKTIGEAKASLSSSIGKDEVTVVDIGGRKTIMAGTDCAYDAIWDRIHSALMGFAPEAGPDEDLAVEEASRLRDEFIKSLERVCGAKAETVFTEF
jgi:hypothetical protein